MIIAVIEAVMEISLVVPVTVRFIVFAVERPRVLVCAIENQLLGTIEVDTVVVDFNCRDKLVLPFDGTVDVGVTIDGPLVVAVVCTVGKGVVFSILGDNGG